MPSSIPGGARRTILRACVSAAPVLMAVSPAFAQRTDDNATTQAEDAFGTSIGDQTIGLYGPTSVRGFSPIDAGNVRLEGLYFDQQAPLNSRLSNSNTVRVGLSTQDYAFPAPTGIADYTLRRPGKMALASGALTIGPWATREADLDLQLPLAGDRLGIAAGGTIEQYGRPDGISFPANAMSVLLRWAPNATTEIMPFWSHAESHDNLFQPLIFTSGAFLPKRVPRNMYLGQPWTDNEETRTNEGVLARTTLLGFDIRAGLFRSIDRAGASTADLLFDTDRNGLARDRQIVVENDDGAASTSGELRVQRGWIEGPRQHLLVASVRARSLDRLYGGADTIDLGASPSDRVDQRAVTPAIAATLAAVNAKTEDRVRQWTFGLAYQGKWTGVGELIVGLQKTRYTKTITEPGGVTDAPTKAAPWLPSVAGALYVTPHLAAYASFTRGLEESAAAPANAINRNAAPPAIRTEQKDAGLRWSIAANLTAIIGVFDVAKPYFNVDGAGVFRQLGQVRNRGVEASLAGTILPGLNVVAGMVLIDARVSGEEVANGAIGPKPVASIARDAILSFDYRFPRHPAFSIDADMEATSQRVGDVANRTFIPARAVFDLGARYRLTLGRTKFLLRGQVQNLFDTFGWLNGPSGYYLPNASRRYLLELLADI